MPNRMVISASVTPAPSNQTVTPGVAALSLAGFAPVIQASAVPTVFAQDTFADTPGTLLRNHTPDVGGSWVAQFPNVHDLVIDDLGNNVTGQSVASWRPHYINAQAATAEYSVEGSLYVASDYTLENNQAGVMARYASGARTGYRGGYEFAQWRITRDVAGTSTTMAESVEALEVGKTYRLRLVVTDDAKELWVDSGSGFVLKLTTSDNTVTDKGYSGVFVGSDGVFKMADMVARNTTGAQTVIPGVAGLTLTGYPPTIVVEGDQIVTPGVAALNMAGYAPIVTSAPIVLTPGVAGLNLTGFAPTVTVVPPGGVGGVVDPTQLPLATGQLKDPTFRYGRDLSAGEWYVDPRSGIVVIKLTDANTPISNYKANVHDAQRTSVSLPWGPAGEMRTVCIMVDNFATSEAWLVDVNVNARTLENWRNIATATNGSRAAGAISFSNIEPQIMYHVGNGATIRRFNTATDADETTSEFPRSVPGTNRLGILRVSADDQTFCMTQYNREYWVFWHRDTDTFVYPTPASKGQGDITPEGDWGMSFDANTDSQYAQDTDTGVRRDPPEQLDLSHPQTAPGNRIFAAEWADGSPEEGNGRIFKEWKVDPNLTAAVGEANEILDSSRHHSGHWVIGQPEPPWGFVSTYASAQGPLLHYAIAYIKIDPGQPVDVRLVAHHDSLPVNNFDNQPHAQGSPDGAIVVWQSNQNSEARGETIPDVFLGILPTTG